MELAERQLLVLLVGAVLLMRASSSMLEHDIREIIREITFPFKLFELVLALSISLSSADPGEHDCGRGAGGSGGTDEGGEPPTG